MHSPYLNNHLFRNEFFSEVSFIIAQKNRLAVGDGSFDYAMF